MFIALTDDTDRVFINILDFKFSDLRDSQTRKGTKQNQIVVVYEVNVLLVRFASSMWGLIILSIVFSSASLNMRDSVRQ